MQSGVLGLGRMGANMVRRLMHDGDECVVADMKQSNVGSMAWAASTFGLAASDELLARYGRAWKNTQ